VLKKIVVALLGLIIGPAALPVRSQSKITIMMLEFGMPKERIDPTKFVAQ
jgi:hypothetical protein